MNHSILVENAKRRISFSMGLLICFATYTAWQMGYIYYMGPSLVIAGRTPLPISMDHITTLIALGYIFAIIHMLVLPHFVIWSERISAIISLLSVFGLYLPLADDGIRMLIYIQAFCCCFMIGFETFIIVNFFTERSAIDHLTIAYGVMAIIIAVIQNDLVPCSFSVFRIATILMLILMLCFFFQLPTRKNAYPIYQKKGDGLRLPKKLFIGTYAVAIVSCFMTLCGTTAVAEVTNGVSTLYLADAIGAFILYILYIKKKIHPLHTVSIFMCMSVVGFLFLFASFYAPALCYPACILIGLGLIPCQMLPLYSLTMMKTYPSRLIAPSIMVIALITVLIQSALVEMFRTAPHILNLVYLSIMIILTLIYLRVEPHLIYVLNRRFPVKTQTEPDPDILTQESAEENLLEEAPTIASEKTSSEAALIALLTKREKEVLELIGCGYSNADIAKMLFISEHTVNDHTKKIYRKLDVHSRHAAASIMNRWEASKK